MMARERWTLCPLVFFKAPWPPVGQSGAREPKRRAGKAGGMRRERKAKRVIEGFRVILRLRMAVSTCLHNLLELNI